MTIRFHDDQSQVPPLRFETGLTGGEAERLTHFIWCRIMYLLENGYEQEANSLLEEFDEPGLWDEARGSNKNA